MDDEVLYRKIERLTIILTLLASGIAVLITRDIFDVYSVLIGGAMGLIGFWWIKQSSKKLIYSKNASKLAVASYIMRYIIYGIIFYIGIKVGLNAIFMLIGFSMLNISIKIIMLKEKEEV